ncbi:MAG: hypothetical protein IKG19_06665 [Lachnospiraceae bacterium]|nr:hypothetical protein [Lachnospiraceae bacterium]
MRSPLKFVRKNLLACAIVLAISLTANLAQPLRMDDATFLRTFTSHGHDLWAWAQEYWITWSGRVVPHGIFLLLLSFSVGLVDIMNGILAAFSLVLSCIWVFSGKEGDTRAESLILVFLAVSLYMLTPTEILDVMIFWKTASVLYVWAFCAMLYALLPFTPILSNAEDKNSESSSDRSVKRHGQTQQPPLAEMKVSEASSDKSVSKRGKHGKPSWAGMKVSEASSDKSVSKRGQYEKPSWAIMILLVLSSIYCAGFEPSGSFYFVFGGILIVLAFLTGRLRSIPRYAYFLWILTTAAFFFFLSAPGNMVRFREEALFWFPNYGLLGFTDKLLLGTAYTLGACLHEIYLPVLVLSVIVFLLMVAHRRGILLTLTAAFPMLYYGLYLFAKESPAYAFVYNDVYGFYTSANWFATFLGMFAIIVTAFLIFIAIGDELDFKNALFYCGAVAEQVVMGFTPTVAVSISRSSFFSRELLMIPICALLLELVRSLRTGSGDTARVSHKDKRGYYENI